MHFTLLQNPKQPRYFQTNRCAHALQNKSVAFPEIMAPTDVVVLMPPTSPRPPETPPGSLSHIPPNSPGVQGSLRVDTIERFEHAVEKLTQVLKKVEATSKCKDIKSNPIKQIEAGKPKIRASKQEYKLVDEVYVPCFMVTIVLTLPLSWDAGVSKYKAVDSAVLPEAVTDMDEYVFIIRARIGKSIELQKYLSTKIEIPDKQTFEQVFYINIKSDGLRDVLRIILRDMRGLSLREDKITVWVFFI